MPGPVDGQRLRPEVLAVTVGGHEHLQGVPVARHRGAGRFFDSLELTEKERMIAAQILKEIDARLGFLDSVGLELPDPVPGGGHPVRRREPSAFGWRPRSVPA